jgi:Na+/H+ antiporter NhaC
MGRREKWTEREDKGYVKLKIQIKENFILCVLVIPLIIIVCTVATRGSRVEVLDSLMGCDLGNICAKAER